MVESARVFDFLCVSSCKRVRFSGAVLSYIIMFQLKVSLQPTLCSKCFPHTNIIMIVRRLVLTYVGGFHTLRLLFLYVVCFTHEVSSFFFIAVACRTHVYYFVLYVVSCHLYTLLS